MENDPNELRQLVKPFARPDRPLFLRKILTTITDEARAVYTIAFREHLDRGWFLRRFVKVLLELPSSRRKVNDEKWQNLKRIGVLFLNQTSYLFMKILVDQVYLPEVKEGELLVLVPFLSDDASVAKLLQEQCVGKTTIFLS